MGLSWSKRRDDYHPQPQNPSPSQPQQPPPPPPNFNYAASSSSSSSSSALVPLPSPQPQPQPPPNYNYAAPYPSQPYPIQNHYPPPTPPPPVPNPYYYQYSGGGYNACGNTIYNPNPYYGGNQSNWWTPIRPPLVVLPPPPQPPVPYVDHQQAKKVRNDVNVHKDTIKIEVDEKNPDSHLVTFTFDALVDGSITIFYFAKEGPDCRCTPLYPDAYVPVTIPFLKGLGQKFCQPSGTGIDLGFFELDDLSKPSTNEDVFPLVIYAESCKALLLSDGRPDQVLPTTSHAQITEAVLDRKNGGSFEVKVIKQILWIEGVRYELREIYGIGNSAESDINKDDSGEECVICMSEPKDTAVLPCRHMCMCSDCAKELRLQTNKCPICRQPIEELIEIKVNRGDQ